MLPALPLFGHSFHAPSLPALAVPTAPQATPTAPPLPVNSAAQGSVQGAEHSAAPPCLFRPVPIRVPTPASQPALPPALPSAFQPAFHAVAMQGRAQPLPHRHHGANAHPTANAGAPHRKGTGQIMAPAPANDSARSSFTVAWSRPGADGASASVFGRFAQPPGPLARSSCDTGATDTATLAPVGACQEAPTAPLGPWAGVAQSSRSRSVDLGSFASLSAFAGTKRSLCCVEDSVGDAADGPGCREPKRMSVDVWGMYGANGAGPAAGRGGDGGGVGKGKEESGMDISMRSALYMPAQGMSSGGSGGRA